MSLTLRILLGMAAGLVVGLALNHAGPAAWIDTWLLDGVFHVIGEIFLASLKVLVVPLVFVSLVCGTAALDDIKRLGRVGGKTLAFYVGTTAAAVSLALAAAVLVRPGAGFELTSDARFSAPEAPPLTKTIIDIFPTNPIQAMAEGNMLQIIVFAILFGLALTLVGEKGKRWIDLFSDLNEVIMKMVMIMMYIAPLGVFALIAKVFARQGFAAIAPLATYFFTVLGVLVAHVVLTYGSLLRVVAGLSPIVFFRKFREVLAFAFSTASSNATLPVTMENVEHRLGVHNSIASFTIPLGATINMDGTAIMQGVAAAFIAQAYGIDIGFSGYLMIVLTATLASIGTAGVPGVGLVTLAMVLRQVNLPVEGIALIIGVDRLLDMARTAVNVTGDAVVSCMVARSENQLSKDVFDSPDAGPSASLHGTGTRS